MQRVLFVHAHPDDESISTGATIATLVAAGDSVTVLTCTRGERGEVIPDDLAHLEGTDGLGPVRELELAAAMAALGVRDHRMLGSDDARWQGRDPRVYRDSGMRWSGSGTARALDTMDPWSLTSADLGEVAADIAAVMAEIEPDVVVSYRADGGYGHPDHIRVHQATRTAAEVMRVPFYVIDPDARQGLTVDAAPVLERKRAALAAHRTQVTLEGDTFSLSSGAPRRLAEPERFRRLKPPVTEFAGYSLVARIAICLIALVVGALAGVVLTVSHQATVAGIPWGIIVAIVVSTALIAGLRLVFVTRLVAAAAATGLLGASALLSVQTQGGSILVPDNIVGYIWTFAPVVVSLVVLAWPRVDPPAGHRIAAVPAAKGLDHP